jgi:beta-lactamase regulating signal transducer with metallopeptidase domain
VSGWSSHLVLGSTGLALTVMATALVLRVWRRAPIPSYRLAVAVLAAALLLPAAQLGARWLGLSIWHPVRALVASLSLERVARTAAPDASTIGASEPDIASVGASALPAQALDPALLALTLLGQSEAARAPEDVAIVPAPAQSPLARFPWQVAVAVLYGLGLAVALARTARRLHRTHQLLANALPVRDERVLAIWREVSAGSQLAGRARLIASESVNAPACFGLGRPAIVLPANDDLARRRDVLACVLTHELVHLERRDGWVLLGEELLRAVFWFHPAAWWLVARLERLREVSCDLLVVRRTGKRRRYAEALVEYAAWMQAGERLLGGRAEQPAAVVPWSGSKGQLTRRIEMLLDDQGQQGGRARYVAPAAIGIVFAFLWSGQLALAGCATTKHGECKECEHEHGETVACTGAPGVVTVCVNPDGTATVAHGATVAAHGATVAAQGACEAGACATVAAQGVAVAPSGASAGAHGAHGATASVNGVTVHSGQGVHTFTFNGDPVQGVQVDGHGSTVELKDGTTVLSGDGKVLALAPDGKSVDGHVLHGGMGGSLATTVHGQVLDLKGRDGGTIGIVVGEADDTLAEQIGQDKDDVVVVRQVMPGSRAERDGLKAHDVILRVDGEGGNGKKLLERARNDLEDGHDVEVIVIRKGGEKPIVLRAEPGKGGVKALTLGEDGKPDLQGFRVETGEDGSFRVYGLGGGQGGGQSGGLYAEGGSGEGGKAKAKAYKLEKDGKLKELMLREYRGDYGSPAEQEELGRKLRDQANLYYHEVDPQQFQEQIKKALEAVEAQGNQLSDEQRNGLLALRGYSNQDAREALEKARKALQELSDQQLGAAAQRSMTPLKEKEMRQWLDASRADQAEALDLFRKRNTGQWLDASKSSQSDEAANLDELKAKLAATQQALDAQRAQIEDLKRALESMKRQRDTTRELR